MGLYVWSSEALKQYGSGTIAAYGEDANEARKILIAGWSAFAKEAMEYLYPETYGGEVQEWHIEDRDEKYALFLKDLEAEPKVLDALFIWGST